MSSLDPRSISSHTQFDCESIDDLLKYDRIITFGSWREDYDTIFCARYGKRHKIVEYYRESK